MHTTFLCFEAQGQCAGWFFAPGTPGHEQGERCDCVCHTKVQSDER